MCNSKVCKTGNGSSQEDARLSITLYVPFFLKKNLNASKPSEHPTQREKMYSAYYSVLYLLSRKLPNNFTACVIHGALFVMLLSLNGKYGGSSLANNIIIADEGRDSRTIKHAVSRDQILSQAGAVTGRQQAEFIFNVPLTTRRIWQPSPVVKDLLYKYTNTLPMPLAAVRNNTTHGNQGTHITPTNRDDTL